MLIDNIVKSFANDASVPIIKASYRFYKAEKPEQSVISDLNIAIADALDIVSDEFLTLDENSSSREEMIVKYKKLLSKVLIYLSLSMYQNIIFMSSYRNINDKFDEDSVISLTSNLVPLLKESASNLRNSIDDKSRSYALQNAIDAYLSASNGLPKYHVLDLNTLLELFLPLHEFNPRYNLFSIYSDLDFEFIENKIICLFTMFILEKAQVYQLVNGWMFKTLNTFEKRTNFVFVDKQVFDSTVLEFEKSKHFDHLVASWKEGDSFDEIIEMLSSVHKLTVFSYLIGKTSYKATWDREFNTFTVVDSTNSIIDIAIDEDLIKSYIDGYHTEKAVIRMLVIATEKKIRKQIICGKYPFIFQILIVGITVTVDYIDLIEKRFGRSDLQKKFEISDDLTSHILEVAKSNGNFNKCVDEMIDFLLSTYTITENTVNVNVDDKTYVWKFKSIHGMIYSANLFLLDSYSGNKEQIQISDNMYKVLRNLSLSSNNEILYETLSDYVRILLNLPFYLQIKISDNIEGILTLSDNIEDIKLVIKGIDDDMVFALDNKTCLIICQYVLGRRNLTGEDTKKISFMKLFQEIISSIIKKAFIDSDFMKSVIVENDFNEEDKEKKVAFITNIINEHFKNERNFAKQEADLQGKVVSFDCSCGFCYVTIEEYQNQVNEHDRKIAEEKSKTDALR